MLHLCKPPFMPDPRCSNVEALAVAHIDALLALHSAEEVHHAPQPALMVAHSVACMVEFGPAALAARRDVQELFVSNVGCLAQVRRHACSERSTNGVCLQFVRHVDQRQRPVQPLSSTPGCQHSVRTRPVHR